MIHWRLGTTSRVARSAVGEEVGRRLVDEGRLDNVRELVAGASGRTVFEPGDIDAGIWAASLAQRRIHDVPTVEELLTLIVDEDATIIGERLASLATPVAESEVA